MSTKEQLSEAEGMLDVAELEVQLSAARKREQLMRDNLQFERELHDTTRREAAEAQASEQKLRRLLVALAEEQSESISPEPENHPDHGHEVVGVWDDDNGEIAGKPCALCAIWNAAKAEALGTASNSGTALAAAIEQAVAPYEKLRDDMEAIAAGTPRIPLREFAMHALHDLDAARKGGA